MPQTARYEHRHPSFQEFSIFSDSCSSSDLESQQAQQSNGAAASSLCLQSKSSSDVDDLSDRESEDIHETGPEQDFVMLLSFSRNPQCVREALQACPKLKTCRQMLAENGFSLELSSGTKLFVHPWQYEAVMHAVADRDLKAWHIITASDLEEIVKDIMLSLPKKHKVYFRDSEAMSLAGAGNTPDDFVVVDDGADEISIVVSRTFINIDVPTSMFSRSFGPKTNSTTDADGRKGKNPRL